MNPGWVTSWHESARPERGGGVRILKALVACSWLWDLEHGSPPLSASVSPSVRGAFKQMTSHVNRCAAFTALTGIIGV